MAIFIYKQGMDFNKKYEDVINGNIGVPGEMRPLIPVTYEYKDFHGELKEDVYFVPTLSATPEWQFINVLKVIFVMLLPWAAPKSKEKRSLKGLVKTLASKEAVV